MIFAPIAVVLLVVSGCDRPENPPDASARTGQRSEENGSGEPVKTFRKEYTVYFRINRLYLDYIGFDLFAVFVAFGSEEQFDDAC